MTQTLRPFLVIVVLWMAGLGAAAQFGKVSASFPQLVAHYSDYPFGVTLLVSVVGMVGLILGVVAGLLVARIGARRAILGALLIGAAMSLLESFLPPFPLMLIARIVEGASHLAIVVVGPVAIAATAGERLLGAAMTLWSSFFGVTYALLFLIAPHFDVPGLFRLHMVWMLAIAAVLWAIMPRSVGLGVAAPSIGLLAEHLRIYRSPFLAGPATGFVFYTVTYVALMTILPVHAAPGYAEVMGIVPPLVSIAASLTLGVWLLNHMPAWRLARWGFALVVVMAMALWLLWDNGLGQFLAAMGISMGAGIVQGASFASIPQLNTAPPDRARAAGAIAQMGNLGTTTGTPLLALIIQTFGASTGMLAFVGGFSALGIAVLTLQARRRQIRST